MKKSLKRNLSLILALATIFSSVYSGFYGLNLNGIFAINPKAVSESDFTFSLNTNGESYSITGCNTSIEGDLIIPDTHDGLPVVDILERAFSGCNILSVSIPNTIKHIGESAFAYCMNMKSVSIGTGVTSIKRSTFQGCSNLIKVEIPDSVTRIEGLAFECCESLIDINIPESVKYIGVDAFNYTGLSNNESNWIEGAFYVDDCLIKVSTDVSGRFEVKNGTRLIAANAVAFCENITELVLPESLTDMGEIAFCGCTGLKTVNLPKSVENIGYAPFGFCTNLTEINVASDNPCYSSLDGILFDKSQETLIQYPFRTETSYVVPNTVKTIAQFSFSNNTNIVDVTIPDNVENIEEYAFSSCTSLISVSIGSVNNIGIYCFSDCENLKYCELSDSINNISFDAFYGTYLYNDETSWENGVLYIGNHLITTQETISGEYIVKENTVTVAERAFYNRNIDSVSFPESLKHIGADSFLSCGLEKINLNEGLVSIGSDAFAQNYFKEIKLPNSIKTIKDGAFGYCENLKTIDIPLNIEFIEEDAFIGCVSMDTLVLQELELTNIDKFIRFSDLNTKVENTSSATFIGTGTEIKITEKDVPERTITCIIKYDINGDGVCDVLDAVEVQRASKGHKTLDSIYLMAADSNSNDTVDDNDYQAVVNKVLE